MAEDITRSEEILVAISSPAQEIPFSSFIVSGFLVQLSLICHCYHINLPCRLPVRLEIRPSRHSQKPTDSFL
jgi:hypothetical protein